MEYLKTNTTPKLWTSFLGLYRGFYKWRNAYRAVSVLFLGTQVVSWWTESNKDWSSNRLVTCLQEKRDIVKLPWTLKEGSDWRLLTKVRMTVWVLFLSGNLSHPWTEGHSRRNNWIIPWIRFQNLLSIVSLLGDSWLESVNQKPFSIGKNAFNFNQDVLISDI